MVAYSQQVHIALPTVGLYHSISFGQKTIKASCISISETNVATEPDIAILVKVNMHYYKA